MTNQTLPRSDRLLGWAANFLRLREEIQEHGIKAPTAKRFFNEHPSTSAEMREAIIAGLARALFPVEIEEVAKLLPPGEPLSKLAARVVRESADRWDGMVAKLQSIGHGLPANEDLPIPFLRLLILDGGVRWGAWQVLGLRHGKEAIYRPGWFEADAFRRRLDEEAGARNMTLASIDERLQLDPKTRKSWSHHQPTEKHVDDIANVLEPGEPSKVATRLRLAAGADEARRKLEALLKTDRVTDFMAAFERTAKLTVDILLTGDSARFRLDAALVDLVRRGASAELGPVLCEKLATKALHPQVSADFKALPQPDWWLRINEWNKNLVALEEATALPGAFPKAKREQARACVDATRRDWLRMGGFDERGMEVDGASRVPGFAASLAHSAGDQGAAIAGMREAVAHTPGDWLAHYQLGAFLGECVSPGRLQLVAEALHHCSAAFDLAPVPKKREAAIELGIVLRNAGRWDEAEETFGTAEPFAKDSHVFHYARGLNLLFAGRCVRAAKCFREALRLRPRHDHAKACLVDALEQSGDGESDEARGLRRDLDRRLPTWRREIPRAPA